MDDKLRARPLAVDSAAVLGHNAPLVYLTALLVVVPLAALETFATHVEFSEAGELVSVEGAARISGAIVGIALSMLGTVFFSGAIEKIAAGEVQGTEPARPAAFFGNLPYRRLIGADLLVSLMIFVGLVLLIVPGILIMVWFALTGPIIGRQRKGILWSMRHSYRLVRGNSVRVGIIVIGMLVLEDLVGLGLDRLLGSLEWTRLGEYLSNLGSSMVVMPLNAVLIVLATLSLHEIHENRSRRHASASP